MKPPEWLEARMRADGGVTPDGKPQFRIVWGSDRMAVMGGKWTDRDVHGNPIREVIDMRSVPKYPNAVNRWVFEEWRAPETFGTRESWIADFTKIIDGQAIETMGPFPNEGEYELVKVLQTPNGHFVPLTSTICDVLIHTARQNKEIPRVKRIEKIREQRAADEKAKEARLDARIEEMARPWWARYPHIVVPESYAKESK